MKKLKKRIHEDSETEEFEIKIEEVEKTMEAKTDDTQILKSPENNDSDIIRDVELNMIKLQNDIIGINQTMCSMVQSSQSEIETHKNHLSSALEQGILSQDQRLKHFESVIQNSLERLSLGIEQRFNDQKLYLDNQIKSYDDKINEELRNQPTMTNRRNYTRQNNTRNHTSPMSIDDTPTTSRKKDGNFLLALKAFPAEKNLLTILLAKIGYFLSNIA